MQIDNPLKEAYEQSPERFVPPNNPELEDRLNNLVNIIEETKAEMPEVIAATLQGSMVKGYATPESDIDGFIFIDNERLANDGKSAAFAINKHGYGEFKLPVEVKSYYKESINGRIQNELSLKSEQVEQLFITPISTEIIDELLKAKSDQITKTESGTTPDFKTILVTLSAMFHKELTSGLKPYQTHLLNRLSEMGELGEDLWEIIIRETEWREQFFTADNPHKYYPRTLDEAKKAYLAD
jgi:predicted nucleotidyltransferase